MATAPRVNAVKAALDRMNTSLKGRLQGRHQHDGVRWMLKRELELPAPNGGILADDMGLGKTMQAIAVICANPMPTLIVCLVPTMTQWTNALYDFGGIRALVVNVSYKGILPADAQVVITGYSSFQQGKGRGPTCLKDFPFKRIILDEGHNIRNKSTRVFQEISQLSGTHRWILSGTPIQNSSKDLNSLATWIGIDTSLSNEAICKEYVLRRTQEGEALINPRIALPKLTTEVKRIPFKYPDEAKLYRRVERYFEAQMEAASSSRKHNTAMEGITRCRQICSHPRLYTEGLKRKQVKKRARRQQFISDSSSSEEDESDGDNEKPLRLPRVKDNKTARSTKLDYLCDELCKHSPYEKCLVFCAWTTEMKLLQTELKRRSIAALIFDGGLSRDQKDNVLYNFMHSSIPVLVLQIVCGATGLNLQCASRVYISSPHWNPTIEAQAISRAWRMGQTKCVTCVRIVIEDTIEERCLRIQNSKLGLISDALHDDSLLSRLGAQIEEDGLTKDELDRLFADISYF